MCDVRTEEYEWEKTKISNVSWLFCAGGKHEKSVRIYFCRIYFSAKFKSVRIYFSKISFPESIFRKICARHNFYLK